MSGEVFVLSLDGEPSPRPLFTSPAYEGGAALSPDKRWLAYCSNESGRFEVYVRPFPDASRKLVVSTSGGNQPVWSRDGKELFYRNGSQMLAVPVRTGRDLDLGTPEVLFDQEFSFGGSGTTFAQFDVAGDGRFLLFKRDTEPGRLHVVLNWTAELTRLTQAH